MWKNYVVCRNLLGVHIFKSLLVFTTDKLNQVDFSTTLVPFYITYKIILTITFFILFLNMSILFLSSFFKRGGGGNPTLQGFPLY